MNDRGASAKSYHALHELRHGITLLEASAGTGKTYGITDLVLRLVAEQGLKVQELLIVTFTRAATAELRDRVRRRLSEACTLLENALLQGKAPDPAAHAVLHHIWQQSEPEDRPELRLRLLRAVSEFDEAAISTIHGFCQRALARCALETGLGFDSELTQEISPILDEIVDDFRNSHLRHAELSWYRHVSAQARVTRDDLRGLAAMIEAEPQLPVIAPERWAEPCEPAAAWRAACEEFASLWCSGAGDQARTYMLALLKAEATQGKTLGKLKTKKAADALDRAFDHEADTSWDQLKPFVEHFCLSGLEEAYPHRGPAELPDELRPLFEAGDRVVFSCADQLRLAFVDFVRSELPRRKAARNQLSYNDLLHSLASGLDAEARESLLAAIRAEFKAALIDEFQDTDPIQWRIFHEIFGAAPNTYLYLIGDPKQAIYGFRGADIFTYLAAKDHANAGAYTMATNWRSDRQLVEAFNHLLGQRGVFGDSAIEYVQVDTPEHHHRSRLRLGERSLSQLQLRFFPRGLPLIGPDESPDLDAEEQKLINRGWAWDKLSTQAARDIVELLDAGAQIENDEGQSRPLEPGDCAVIVRTHKESQHVLAAFEAAGVPAIIAGSGRIYDAPEVLWMQRLLRALAAPNDQAHARALWATPLFELGATELLRLVDDEQRWEQELSKLQSWSHLCHNFGFMRAFRSLLVEEGIAERLLTRRGGERAFTNLQHLAELVHNAEQGLELSVEGLVAWLEQRRSGETHDADTEELRLETDALAVAIVTIHRSKGLEYPVVCCPFLWALPGLDDRFGGLRNLKFHQSEAPHTAALDLRSRASHGNKASHIDLAARERACENLRLLYVALTRAKHRCIVYTGAFKGAAEAPLATVLHSGLDPEQSHDGDGQDRLERGGARMLAARDRQLLEDLWALASRAGAHEEDGPRIDVVIAEAPQSARRRPAEASTPALCVRTFPPRRLDRGWRRSSFSAMTRHHAEEGSKSADGIDHDQDSDREPAPPKEVAPNTEEHPLAQPVTLSDFPRGADEGTFLHSVLEHLDFTDFEAGIDELLAREMQRHQIAEEYAPALRTAVAEVITTPLGRELGDLTLAQVERCDRLDEMAFDLPIAGGLTPLHPTSSGHNGLHPDDLISIFQLMAASDDPEVEFYSAYAQKLTRLQFESDLRGFLTGAIDLIFRTGDQRYYVVDYKSNWLGDREEELSCWRDYHQGALVEAMFEHDYVLQYHLYSVALHRYLGWRMGDNYDYEHHFGGVRYLFLRGMAGGSTHWHDEDPYGVFAKRPPRSIVLALDECLRDPVNWRRALAG